MILEEQFAASTNIDRGVEVALVDLTRRRILASRSLDESESALLFADELDYGGGDGSVLLVEPARHFLRRTILIQEAASNLPFLFDRRLSSSMAVVVMARGALPRPNQINGVRRAIVDLYLTQVC